MVVFLTILFLLLVAYGFLIDYYRRSWHSIPEFETGSIADTRISVIVAVRNEEKNIGVLLDALEAQDYPRHLFEVIVVDDHSVDQTWAVLNNRKTDLIRPFQLEAGLASKKQAIAFGVSAAAGELIVTTDADCTMGAFWLRTLSSFYKEKNAVFIAAPVSMEASRSILGLFQQLDFLTLQGITGAAVQNHLHTMCNGANLAFQKKAFEEVKGFEGIDHIPSGDDMLLMYKIYERYPDRVHFVKSAKAIVTTVAEKTWRSFFNQRIRWASKAVHYREKKMFYILLLVYLTNAGFIVLGAVSIIELELFWLFLLFLLGKMLIDFPFVNAIAIFFGKKSLMKLFPFFEPLHIVYVVATGGLGRFGSYTWKSRLVKNKP